MQKILALAKKRAPSMLKFGVSEITDELLGQEVVVRVSAGVGSPDPMQKMAKLGQAVELLTKILRREQEVPESGELVMKEEAWIDEIMGNAGQRDGFDRFFSPASRPAAIRRQAALEVDQLQGPAARGQGAVGGQAGISSPSRSRQQQE
jgi:hypothetical protein